MSELLTPIEASRRLRIGERTLRDLRQKGRIRYVALTARKIAYRVEDCDEYVEAQVTRAEQRDTKPAPKGKASVGKAGTVVPFTKQV